MTTFWYSTEHDPDKRYQCLTGWEGTSPRELRHVIQDCAENYHYKHGGLDDDWPIEFKLYKNHDGQCLGTYSVDREAVPEFIASDIGGNA